MQNNINIKIPDRGQFKNHCLGRVPDKGKSIALLNNLIDFLFPILSINLENKPDEYISTLHSDLVKILDHFDTGLDSYTDTAEQFIKSLPDLYARLVSDAEAIFEGDPASRSVDEVVITYPGFYAIIVYRAAHELWRLGIPVMPRLWTEYAHGKTGIDIHPGAIIGQSFCIDHGTGIVIGESSQIGNNVKIYQGVTLGALSVNKTIAGTKRHPTIEDNVTIYAGSTILGGNTVVGKNSIIGGNVWLTRSVEPDSIVINKHKIQHIDKNQDGTQALNYII